MHTPGPWNARQINPHKYALDPHLITSGSMHICEVDGADDARLIAAAPELLQACELTRQWMLGGQPGPHTDSALLDVIEAAIKKARGQ
jgi:hypothetical protein